MNPRFKFAIRAFMASVSLALVIALPSDVVADAAPKLPTDIKWLTNDSDPEYGSPKAKKGGTYHTFIDSFPMTFRTTGPDSNGSFRSWILDNQWSLIGIHPNTENILPQLATHWAFSKDGKTMFFKLNKNAKWSDGKPVTASDYTYTLEFMRSKHIVAPWYNNYYATEITAVTKYDDYTIGVTAAHAKPDLHMVVSLGPVARHFYGELKSNFVKKYNWTIAPNTGPYYVSKVKKGKSVTFKRKKNFWAKDLRYYRNRFNVDKINVKVIRDRNVAFEHFKKGKLDSYMVVLPNYWHDKAKGKLFKKGYIHKLWFYTDSPQPTYGFWLNLDQGIWKDKRLRYAFAHAINMKKMIKTVLHDDYERLHNFYTGYGKYTDTSIKARPFDIKKVEKLMKEAKYKRGPDGIWTNGKQRFSVKVTYGTPVYTERLVVLKEEAKKAGIEFVFDKLDGPASFKTVLEKKHVAAFQGMGTSLRPSPWQYFHSKNAHKPQNNNFFNFDDKEMDKYIEAYDISTNEKERQGLAKKIQHKIVESGCFVPTYMVPYFRVAYWRYWQVPAVPGTRHSDTVFNATAASTGGMFWFDDGLKKETKMAMKKKKPYNEATRVDKTYKVDI